MRILRSLLAIVTLAGLGMLAWIGFQRLMIEWTRWELAKFYQAGPTLEPIFRHPSLQELAGLPTVTAWTYPMGSARGAMIYNAQPFGTTRHLGDDLNGIGGENSDLGEDVYAVGDGLVTFAENVGGGWGKIVIIVHAAPAPLKDRFAQTRPDLPSADTLPRRYIQSFYAHLEEIRVSPGQRVDQQAVIGSVGSADGQYLAHLHFEMRELVNPYIGPGYRPAPPPGWESPEYTLTADLADEFSRIEHDLTPMARRALKSKVSSR
jgi:murein DD-endopeptidase MepM/ murein hydrolase activator NlpD